MSANIKTHYTLEDTTVTKCEGGSSVKVSTGQDDTYKLEIYFSTDRRTRDCAIITDFPKQLIAELQLEPADLPDLDSLLQVPLASLRTLLIKKGITAGDGTDDHEEALTADSICSDSSEPAVVEYTRAVARSEAANTTLQPYLNHQPTSRPTTPSGQSHDHLNMISNESPFERPVTPRPVAGGLYSTDNRNHNRERLLNFAQSPTSAPSLRNPDAGDQSSSNDSSFNMSVLRGALEAAEPTPVTIPVRTNRGPRRRAGPIPNRNEEQMARDFEVGFLGELFVSISFQQCSSSKLASQS